MVTGFVADYASELEIYYPGQHNASIFPGTFHYFYGLSGTSGALPVCPHGLTRFPGDLK